MKQKVVSQWLKGYYIHCQLYYRVVIIVTEIAMECSEVVQY
jgi:hypothetical protein